MTYVVSWLCLAMLGSFAVGFGMPIFIIRRRVDIPAGRWAFLMSMIAINVGVAAISAVATVQAARAMGGQS